LDRHDDDAVVILDEHVHDENPPPWAEQEADVSPPPSIRPAVTFIRVTSVPHSMVAPAATAPTTIQ